MEVPRFKSNLFKGNEEFKLNHQFNTQLVAQLQARLLEWQSPGPSRRVNQEKKRGKLLGRERVNLVLDEDSPFLEIGALAGWGVKGNKDKGNSLITGIGIVAGVECMIVCNVPTVARASRLSIFGNKWDRCSDIALKCRLPFIQLLESGGADLNEAFRAFHTKPNPFYQHAIRSAAKIPTVTVVFGSNIAGGAYNAGMSDYIIMIKKHSHLGLGGSKLVKMATGEDADEESIGGAEMHSTVSGVSDFLVSTEEKALEKVREIVSFLPSEKLTIYPSGLPDQIPPPYYDPEELLGIIPQNPKQSYDIREVFARVVDDSRLSQFKPLYGSSLVCCFAYILGIPVGLIGNNGILFSETAQKGTHFINICNQRGIPIVFFHNVTGFMVGKKYEASGIIKWGSQMVNAVSNSRVPIITIIAGSSFGAANYAQRSYGFDPSFIFSWPMSQCNIMGGEQLSGVLELLARERYKKKNLPADEMKIKMLRTMFTKKITEEQSPYYISARSIDDGIIDPRDTRNVLGFCLSVLCNAKIERSFLKGICRL